MKTVFVLLGVIAAAACGDSRSPLAPTALTGREAPPFGFVPPGTAAPGSTAVVTVAWHCMAIPRTSDPCAPATSASAVNAVASVSSPPALSAMVAQSTVTLSWSATADALSHVIEAGSASGLANLASFDTGGPLLSLTVTGVPPGTYFVRVRTHTAAGLSGPSNEVVVTVADQNPAGFVLELPIRPGDARNTAFGLVPFGVHIGDHGVDGHPGWDIEFVPGATVHAAAAGTVQSVMASGGGGGGFGIQIEHRVGARTAYRTIYGVSALAPGIVAGASIATGQALGTLTAFTRMIGQTTVTYSFTHFQVDDFSSRNGITNEHAVPPERFLSPGARQAADTIFRSAAYAHELVEPFLAVPRDVAFPLTRVWRLAQGGLASQIDITAASAFAPNYTYVLRDGSGGVFETGVIEVNAPAKPVSTLDLRPSGTGMARRGVFSVYEGEMRLDYGAPGAARPSSLVGASVYHTP